MSASYYLSCRAHREQCPAASSSGSLRTGAGGRLACSDLLLPKFILCHARCTLRVTDLFVTYAMWDRQTCGEMMEKHGERGPIPEEDFGRPPTRPIGEPVR